MAAILHTKTFQELTTDELYELLKVRSEVFVVEQNCVYQDMDDDDQHLDDADVLRTPVVGNVEAGGVQSGTGGGEGEIS